MTYEHLYKIVCKYLQKEYNLSDNICVTDIYFSTKHSVNPEPVISYTHTDCDITGESWIGIYEFKKIIKEHRELRLNKILE